jgi:hypothetical protein
MRVKALCDSRFRGAHWHDIEGMMRDGGANPGLQNEAVSYV